MLFSHVFTPLMTKSIGQRIRLTTLPWCLGPGSQAPACCCFKRIYPQSFCWRRHFEVTQCSLTPSDFPIVWAWNMLAHSAASPFCCSAFIRFLLLQSETKNYYFFIFSFSFSLSFSLSFFHFIFIFSFLFITFCHQTLFFFICNFIFFHLQLHFFSFSFVFDGFPLFFIDFHGFPGFQVPRARKMKKKW